VLGGGQEILAEVLRCPAGDVGEMQGSQEAAGEKKMGLDLDWSLRIAGYCCYTSTLATYCIRLQTHAYSSPIAL
jgi:hypothetical protein